MFKKLIGSLFSGSNPLKTVFDGIDNLNTSKEEMEVLKIKAVELELNRQSKELEFKERQRAQYLEDRQGARNLYAKDSFIQKVFSVVFLVAYFGIIWLLLDGLRMAYFDGLKDWQITLVTSLLTQISTKLNTMIDFFFGGSQSEKQNASFDKLQQANKK